MTDNIRLPCGSYLRTDEIDLVHHQRMKVQYGDDGSATDVSKGSPLPVFDQRFSGDAFGRMRVSTPATIFDSKQIFSNQPLFWDDQAVSGAGTSSTYSQPNARTRIGVSLNTAGKRVRQTFMRFNYQPGKSQLILLTGVLTSGAAAGITSTIGYGDDNNGLFFQMSGTTFQIVRRTGVTGSPVNNAVTQANFNGDKVDGTGASGITLDFTKTQIFWIDFEWLGVGSVRMGVVVDGEFILCHQFNNANSLSTVYMSTPNLPLRFAIENDGTGPATTLDHICSSVVSEGGEDKLGQIRRYSTGATFINCNTAGITYALVGLRLKTANLGAAIDIIQQACLDLQTPTTVSYEWHLLLNPTLAAPITFSDVANSSLQAGPGNAGNPSTSTVTGGTRLAGGFAAGGKEAGSIIGSIQNAIRLGAKIDGTRDAIYLCVTPLGANGDFVGSLSWQEFS